MGLKKGIVLSRTLLASGCHALRHFGEPVRIFMTVWSVAMTTILALEPSPLSLHRAEMVRFCMHCWMRLRHTLLDDCMLAFSLHPSWNHNLQV
jgi:hypothetical protein